MMMERNINRQKYFKENRIILLFSFIFFFISFHNVNLYQGFYWDVHEGGPGSGIKILKDFTLSNMTLYLKNYYQPMLIYDMAECYLRCLLVITIIILFTYLLIPLTLYSMHVHIKIKYLMISDGIYFSLISLLLILLHIEIFGRFLPGLEYVLFSFLFLFRLYQYFFVFRNRINAHKQHL